MAVLKGKEASVGLGANTVAEMGSWSLEITRDAIEATSFGDDAKRNEVGMLGWSATIEGYLDMTDTNGQVALEAAILASTLLTTLRLYIDNTSYWTPDTTGDADAGAHITGFTPGAERAGLLAISMSLVGTGELALV